MVQPVKPVPEIFFEKQVSRLCAQHALNMLLQGPFYTADYLADVARELDDRELAVLSVEQRSHFQSQNLDETGFFSLQVIEMALQRCHDLSLINLDNPLLVQYRMQPSQGNAYICNLNEHWFTIRKFNSQWFILNSTSKGPKPISHSYLDVYLAQLRNDGYSIFWVDGQLPCCQADHLTQEALNFYSQPSPSRTPSAARQNVSRITVEDGADNSDDELAKAISLSLSECDSYEKPLLDAWDSAVQQSLQQYEPITSIGVWNEPSTAYHSAEVEDMELQRALQASLHEQMLQQGSDQLEEEQDQADLEMAIQLSLGGMTSNTAAVGQQPCSSRSLFQSPEESRHRGQSPLRTLPFSQSSSLSNYYNSESSKQSSSTFTYNSSSLQQDLMEVNKDDLVGRIQNKAETIEQLLSKWDKQEKKD